MQQQSNVAERLPRGMSRSGPVLFSYGFRPFFLASAIWAMLSIALWVGYVSHGLPVADSYGSLYWHAHEMLYGFAPAVLAGFLLTAIPNWTGRLPISGRPLMLLFGVWVVGRVALLFSGTIGVSAAAGLDSLFLPLMLALCTREVVAGRKWKDLKVIAGLAVLTVANICFHVQVVSGQNPEIPIRLGLGAYTLLITIVGGRILPSFTRNWINQFGRTDFPVPYNRFDGVAIVIGALVLACWAIWPASIVTGIGGVLAALVNAVRLIRWRGWTTWREPILFVLHIAYAFVPISFAFVALGTVGLSQIAVLHVLAIGTVSLMMLAVMTRASRGHTGRKLNASRTTVASYVILAAAAVVRPMAEMMPDHSGTILEVAACAWIIAFGTFVFEYSPFLCRERKPLAKNGG